MSDLGKVLKTNADAICEQIRAEAQATESFVLEVQRFLVELPQDLGKGSLNGMRAQLLDKCKAFLQSVGE